VLETLMIGVFAALDLVLFYLFFEAGLIPMFLIIGIWGGKRRIYASVQVLPLHAARLAADAGRHHGDVLDDRHDRHRRRSLDPHASRPSMQTWLWLAFFASFAVKMPMWPVHTWLPDAHVEAPTAGSVDPGGDPAEDGRLRLHPLLDPDVPGRLASTSRRSCSRCRSIAIIYTSLVALMQEDIKKLIAYSSVAHMGFVTMGIFALTAQGIAIRN